MLRVVVHEPLVTALRDRAATNVVEIKTFAFSDVGDSDGCEFYDVVEPAKQFPGPQNRGLFSAKSWVISCCESEIGRLSCKSGIGRSDRGRAYSSVVFSDKNLAGSRYRGSMACNGMLIRRRGDSTTSGKREVGEVTESEIG